MRESGRRRWGQQANLRLGGTGGGSRRGERRRGAGQPRRGRRWRRRRAWLLRLATLPVGSVDRRQRAVPAERCDRRRRRRRGRPRRGRDGPATGQVSRHVHRRQRRRERSREGADPAPVAARAAWAFYFTTSSRELTITAAVTGGNGGASPPLELPAEAARHSISAAAVTRSPLAERSSAAMRGAVPLSSMGARHQREGKLRRQLDGR